MKIKIRDDSILEKTCTITSFQNILLLR